jgi:uronate dehydrogenase
LPITVAITGGAGEIGSALRVGLAREDFRIRAIDVVPITDGATEDDARLVDLRDASATQSALQGSDAIVHLAAHPTEATFEEIHQSNVLTTYNVYEAARHLGIKRVVFASSVHVSGFYPWGRTTSPVADGAPQLAAHAWPLVQRAAWRTETIEAGVDLVAALLAALPIPDPLSIALNVREIGQALRDAVASATEARKAHGIHAARAIDLLDIRQDPLVENLVTRLTGALAPDTHLVLIVDDAHWADAQLVNLIDVMMSSSAPFLVVTTAWHDTLAIQASQDPAATRANARTFGAWINASKIEHLPVQSVRVSSMSDADLRRMALAVAPRTDEPIVNASSNELLAILYYCAVRWPSRK